MSSQLSISDAIKQELIKCKQDPVYFMKKYYTIQHPTKGRMTFNLFPFQEKSLKLIQRFEQKAVTGVEQIFKNALSNSKNVLILFINSSKIFIIYNI